MTNFQDLQQRALEIRKKYETLNTQSGHDAWRAKEYMMGFVGDVGDLMKLVMAKENLRDIDDVDEKLAHELSDCLWCLFVLADRYNIDLAAAFKNTMQELDDRISKEMAK